MRLTVFGGAVSPSFLKDLKLRVVFKRGISATVNTFFPGTSTDEAGRTVYEQKLGGIGAASNEIIDAVQVESPTLGYLLIGIGVFFGGLILWLVLRR